MAVAVELPALGESVVEGVVSRWLVKEGDRVEVDQPLVEITTDKVDAEIPSPAAGVVEKILVAEGETVPVGEKLVLIDTEGAAARSGGATTPRAARAEPASAETLPAPAQAGSGSAAGAGVRAGEGPRATPVARRLAEAARVDLVDVAGTGPAGRVTKQDLLRHTGGPREAAQAQASAGALETAPAPRRPAASARAPVPVPGGPKPPYLEYQLQPGDRVIPMTPLRRLVAEHMVLSKQTSPHVGTVAEVDLGNVVRLRDAHKRAFREAQGVSLSFLPFVVAASVRALREHPRLNASVLDDAIVEKAAIHVGIAVETEKGLVVPVVRHADRLSLAGLAMAVEDLAERARSKRLSPDELKGGTFTVSNPGREGNLYGFAIINQPQVGILRMGEIVKRPVVRQLDGGDAIVIRPMMYLALSYDHRAVDGAPANAFLHRVRMLLEEADFDL